MRVALVDVVDLAQIRARLECSARPGLTWAQAAAGRSRPQYRYNISLFLCYNSQFREKYILSRGGRRADMAAALPANLSETWDELGEWDSLRTVLGIGLKRPPNVEVR